MKQRRRCTFLFSFQCQRIGRESRPVVQYWLCKNACKYFLCSKHFAESDFCTSERVRLNKVAVPHGSDSFSHSIPQPSESAYYIPSLNSLPTTLTPEHNLHVLPPTRNYGKAFESSTKTPMPVQVVSSSTALAFLTNMREKRKSTSSGTIQVKNRWNTIDSQAKLILLSRLEKGERIVDIAYYNGSFLNINL